MTVPFTPLGNRVVIKADVEDHAPQETGSGLLTAKTLSAAVEGIDVQDSWFVGTIVAAGPAVNRFEIRPYVIRRVRELTGNGTINVAGLQRLADEVTHLPADCPDPLKTGDRVTFSWASGQQITVDGEKFLIMPASEVLAVLDPVPQNPYGDELTPA